MGLFTKKSSGSKQTTSRVSSTSTNAPPPQQLWKIPTPEFHPLRFIPAKNQATTLNFTVGEVRAVAHDILPDGGNHWCFYLQIAPDMRNPREQSVRIDPTPSGLPGAVIPGGSKANIVVSLLAYEVSQQAQHVSHLTVPRGVKVGDFIQAITHKGREKYDFDEMGRGCRNWTSEQIDLFFDAGLVRDRSQVDTAKNNILTEWSGMKSTGRRYPLARGAYYR
ncbi:hypothetical protein ColKHC_06459 [Colletotrichum higginsianum]|nr:hypothetical protein ColKHC_06459 [Colletotrichum higginsianum]